jgi:hypothetical protein
MARPRVFTFTYTDLQRLTGKNLATIFQDVTRKRVDPSDLESLVLYAARFGRLEFKTRLLAFALQHYLSKRPSLRTRPFPKGTRSPAKPRKRKPREGE